MEKEALCNILTAIRKINAKHQILTVKITSTFLVVCFGPYEIHAQSLFRHHGPIGFKNGTSVSEIKKCFQASIDCREA